MGEKELKTVILCIYRLEENLQTLKAMLPTCEFCEHFKKDYEYPLSNGETKKILWCGLHKIEVENGGCEDKEVKL